MLFRYYFPYYDVKSALKYLNFKIVIGCTCNMTSWTIFDFLKNLSEWIVRSSKNFLKLYTIRLEFYCMIINGHLVNTHFLDTFLWFQFNVIFARNILTNYIFCPRKMCSSKIAKKYATYLSPPARINYDLVEIMQCLN